MTAAGFRQDVFSFTRLAFLWIQCGGVQDAPSPNSIAKRNGKMKHFFRTLSSVLTAAALLCCGCADMGAGKAVQPGAQEGNGGHGDSAGPWRYTDTAMGTVVQMTVYTERQEEAETFSGQTMELLAGLEREEISWRLDTSEVCRANESAGSAQGFPLSVELSALLSDCLELWERSEGAFDVTLGAVTRLWNIDQWAAGEALEDFSPPSEELLARALEHCGSGRLRLAEEGAAGDGGLRLYMPEGMGLDLGAVGKGLAMEKALALLADRPDVTGAVISLGGSILTYGSKTEGAPWRVGIVDPFDTSDSIGILTLEGQWCISTSGDYERYVEADGVRYHHILDPETGAPAVSDVRGVTILMKDGLLCDGLSTACYILGPEKGMDLAGQYGAEALFVMADGGIVMSEGMKQCFTEQ